jgi:VanZ family protein
MIGAFPLMRGMTRVFLIAGWLALAAVAFMTLGPIQDRPQVAPAHMEHFTAFLLLGAVFAFAYPKGPWRPVLIVIGSAIFLELLQLATPDRHARLVDAMTKVAGAGVGITLARFVLNYWQAKLRGVPANTLFGRR